LRHHERQAAVAVGEVAAPPEKVVAALAGDGRGYKAKSDASVMEGIWFDRIKHGRRQWTTAK